MAQEDLTSLNDEKEKATNESFSAKEQDEILDSANELEEEVIFDDIDFTQLSKPEIQAILEKELASVKKDNVTMAAFRRVDELLKELKPVLEQLKRSEFEEARGRYVEENGNDEGFLFKGNAETQAIELLSRTIREERNRFFKGLEKAKEENFAVKTDLLQRLRTLVEEESKEADDANMKAGWEGFKKIQEEWKAAGNINSPHNGTLWATYNALVDRYFSIRNIYFELKELDRKRNAELKAELSDKIEQLANTVTTATLNKEVLAEANQLFEDYKHIGPAPREEQEQLWKRFKSAMDKIHDVRRAQSGDLKRQAAEVYGTKSKIYEAIVPFTTFSSGSINDWNAKTKELLAYQTEWVNVKGALPRDEGKELSRKFWSALKTFFHNKGEFFRQLEAKREINLKAKLELCEKAEAILATGEESPKNTQRIIELQKTWKTVGQVPEKYKDSVFARFKAACDAYFDKKRSRNQEVEQEFEDNLAKKEDLCRRIAAAAAEGDATLDQLNAFKAEWGGIGFVPKKDIQAVQKKYISAINTYVGTIGKLSSKERELVALESEVEVIKGGDSDRNLLRKESDIRKKITNLESNISIWQNNIQFFAKSKTSDSLKQQFEKKIAEAEGQLTELKHQLNIIQEAI